MARHFKYEKSLVAAAVSASCSVAGALRLLGLKVSGGNHRTLKMWCRVHEIDTAHFTGAAWTRGLTKSNSNAVAALTRIVRRPDADVFSANSSYSGSLGKRLREIGRKYHCAVCGLVEWLGKPISLHVDHINGTCNDNRLENLRFICPNCHQQTPTWGKKNRSAPPSAGAVCPSASVRRRAQRQCEVCRATVAQRSRRCRPCANKSRGDILAWPAAYELMKLVESSNCRQVAIQLGCSYNALKKHLQKLQSEDKQAAVVKLADTSISEVDPVSSG